MLKNIVYPLLLFVIGSLIYFSCANPVRPTGGPRDTIPPQLTQSVPVNEALNYRGNSIILEFNEFIKTDKLNTQLLITPTVDEEYKVKAGAKKIQLVFEKDAFLENTTYTFNFQNSIKDLTEGNSWENPKVVFSTGNYIDSLSIAGTVTELMTGKPAKNHVVSIYRSNDTLDALTGKPMYFTITDDKGYFQLENLISDQFRIYSFFDKNNNLILNPSDEPYGFLPDPVNLDSSVTGISLKTHTLNVSELRFVSARPIRSYFDIAYSKPVVEYRLSPLDDSVKLYSNLIEAGKKIRVYNTLSISDSIRVQAFVKDSVNNEISDTLYVKFLESKLPREKFQLHVVPERNTQVPENLSMEITFNKPILTSNLDSVLIVYDSVHSEPLEQANILYNYSRDKLTVEKKINLPDDNNQSFTFYAAAGSFISIEHDSSAAISQPYKILDPVNFGSISGSLSTRYDHFTIQLLNQNYSVIKEIKNTKSFSFRPVPPGSYMIRVLIDNNSNGEWEPGNILENIPPEEVIFYLNDQNQPETISIKANWEINDIHFQHEPVD